MTKMNSTMRNVIRIAAYCSVKIMSVYPKVKQTMTNLTILLIKIDFVNKPKLYQFCYCRISAATTTATGKCNNKDQQSSNKDNQEEAGQEQHQVAVSIVILRTKARGGDGIVDVCDDRPLVHGEGVGDLQETNSEGNADQDQK